MLFDCLFGNGAGSAGVDAIPNILSKVRPIKILLQHFHYFLYLEVSNALTVVCFPNHLGKLACRNTKVSHVAQQCALEVKIWNLLSFQEHLVGVAEFWISLVKMRPPRSLVSIRVEHSGQRHDQ